MGTETPRISASVEQVILEALEAAGISPCVAVPCKRMAPLLEQLEALPQRRLIYPTREEEGLGICAGAFLAGAFPVMLIQNSGLGNLVNAYCSLNQYFGIPLMLLISQRGDAEEKVDAQNPMGSISADLLNLLGFEQHTFDRPQQAVQVAALVQTYRRERRSIAALLQGGFWHD